MSSDRKLAAMENKPTKTATMHATPNASMAALAQRCGNVRRFSPKSVHICPIIDARS
jgi:hypothetical protein